MGGPAARTVGAFAYDPSRGRTMLLGRANWSAAPEDLWEWDGASWAERPGLSGTGPSGWMAFDRARGVMVVGRAAANSLVETLDLDTATTSLALSEDQLRAAEAEYQQVSDLYRSQEATSLDIQSSETNLNEARRAVVVSRLTRFLSELSVYFAAGDLKSAVLKEAQP